MVQTLLTLSPTQAVDLLFTNATSTITTPPINDYNTTTYTDPTGIAPGTSWVNAAYGDSTVNYYRGISMKSWWLKQMINNNNSILEKMVLFWHNHFSTELSTVPDARVYYKHLELIRSFALGNFKTFTRQMTTDVCMLYYLNGYLNTNTSPDENYARELQELFTIGKENTPNYTEDDVKAAAKVLTGWRINTTPTIPVAYFDSTKHHSSNKQFSSFYGNAVIPYQSGSNGALETDVLIDMLFSKQQEVAKFICRKLYRFFIYYSIDSTVETNVITPLAQIFINNNWDIVPVLKTLFKSEHFFELNSKGCIIKSPIDFLVGLFNTFKVDIPASMTDYNKGLVYNYVRGYGSLLAQNIGDPPNVSGWPSYYQVPEFHELWINSNTLPKRMVFSDMMLNSGFTAGSGTTIKIDYLNFVSQIPNADDPVILVDYLCNLLLGISISQTKKDALRINNLLSGQTSNYYWTNAWLAYIANPNTANTNIVKPRLLGLLLELTRLPEFQLS
ncbi:MAG: DUF1800 domain-containing protein [Chitinophagia bacterium]|nr:DUF1800 domain-containing protein [Chitinophagia bacterium]